MNTSHHLHKETAMASTSSTPFSEKDMKKEEDNCPWYALQLYAFHQDDIAKALQNKGLEVFIPMEYVYSGKEEGSTKKMIKPVVRNLLFVKKIYPTKQMRKLFEELPYRLSVIKVRKDSPDYYEIDAKEMFEFKAACNPELLKKKYLSELQAKLKKGTPVIVTNGPLKGLTGKLVRSNKMYYLLKEVPGMGVMLKVTKWCCRAIDAK